MTPAEELTWAADQLEDLASKATPGRWKLWGMEVRAAVDGTSNLDISLPVARTFHEAGMRTFNALYIAAMDPLVGKELAGWLRREAMHAGELERMLPACVGAASPALTIARLINGTEIANDARLPPATSNRVQVDRQALADALFKVLQPDHLDDFMFAGERMDEAEAIADELIGRMNGTLRTCRVCGCSEWRACLPDGCSWVPAELDLCTSCVNDQGASAPPTSTAGGD